MSAPRSNSTRRRAAGWALALLLVGMRPLLAAPVDSSSYDDLLQRYVVQERYVDYAVWHANSEDLEALHDYVRTLEDTDTEALSRDEALAYWINLYNAATLRLVLDHWPVVSIRDLGGRNPTIFEEELIEVRGQPMSLDSIENDMLRARHPDPRIHFALNCASVSCPPLFPHAFTGRDIDAELDTVTRRAVSDPFWVDLSQCGDSGRGRIRLSKLFEWYSEDFGGDAGIRSFLAHYRPGDADRLGNQACPVSYKDYDWSLNLPPTETPHR